MKQNILKSNDITSIYLTYIENTKKKYKVELCYIDEKECYFSTTIPQGFNKPAKKMSANLVVYTHDGIYTSDIKILDSSILNNSLTFVVTIPSTWKYSQMRSSMRKIIKIPFKINFNDGYEIISETYDISLGGISFVSKEDIPSLYHKLDGHLELFLPKESNITIKKYQLEFETKFLRIKKLKNELQEKNCYVYKFISMDIENKNTLKNFLIYKN